MKVLSIRIPGRFEDAFIYQGHLLAITEDLSMRRYSLEGLVDSLHSEFPSGQPVLEHLFLRNDWLCNAQFKALFSISGIPQSFMSLFEGLEALTINTERTLISVKEETLEFPAQVILDMEIYNNTLYLGTDAGLYSSHIGVNKHDFVERLNRRHDAPCLSASARYGTVKASCGQDGLYAAIEDFGGSLAPLEYVAPKSLRTGWLDYDIVNYPSQNAPTLIKTQHEKTDRSRYEEQNVLTKIGSHEINLDYLLDTLYVKHGVLKQEVQYTYNILTHLYVQTIDGACYSLSLSISNEEAVSTVHIKKYDHKLSRILSVNTCKAGQVIETENGIYLSANAHKEPIPLHKTGVLSVRTFGRSRRYRNMILLTTENEILLMSAFDDAPYPQTFGKEEWKSVLDNDPFTDEEDEYPIMTDRIPDFDSPP